jgi:hypothetical protein
MLNFHCWVMGCLVVPVSSPNIENRVQPVMHAIFDGSSNHTARVLDGLNIGGGICKGPGGANAPGAPIGFNRKKISIENEGWLVYRQV